MGEQGKSKRYKENILAIILSVICIFSMLVLAAFSSEKLKVHCINVGQGDGMLLQINGQNMVIDTGTGASKSSFTNYLKSQGVKKVDILVLTHPHQDHIGGADEVIKDFDIGTLYMPKVTDNTEIFRNVIKSINKKRLKAIAPMPGETFKFGDANCTVLSPINTSDENINTYSIVIKLKYRDTTFLFTGDALASNEEDMVNKGYDLSADVLKVGHHGSNTSTSQAFLDKVNPKYTVISVGIKNDYGLPQQDTMNRLKTKGVKMYRTDEAGTIICTSDGKNISFNCKPGDFAYASN